MGSRGKQTECESGNDVHKLKVTEREKTWARLNRLNGIEGGKKIGRESQVSICKLQPPFSHYYDFMF